MLFLPIVLTAISASAPALDQTRTSESLALTASSLVLQDAVEEAEEPPLGWVGNISGAITVTDGNTKRKTAAITADAIKHYANSDRWTTSAFWNYSEEGGFRTQRKAGLRTQYDSALDDRTYWYVNGSADTDEQAALDLRWTAGVGLGHVFREDDEWRFAGEAGISYFNEEFDTGVDDDYIAARLAYRANWNYSERLTFSQVTEVFPSIEESDDVYGRMDTRAIYQMTEAMFAQFQWVWDWDNTPAAGFKKSDNLYMLTVGWRW